MPAKTDGRGTIAVGDFVFVDQNAESSPRHLAGASGTIVAIEGSAARMRLSSGETLEIDVSALRLNRRRQRRAVSWDPSQA